MEISEIKFNSALYRQALDRRYRLFFQEFGLPRSVTTTEREEDSIHVAISHNAELIAYGQLTEQENGEFHLLQFVVSPEYQRQGIGTQLVDHMKAIALRQGAQSINLKARVSAVRIYKQSGFVKIGQRFQSNKTGISHVQMVCHHRIEK